MVKLGPYGFCEVKNPALRDEHGKLLLDKHGQVKVMIGDSEYRYQFDWTEPFALHP